MDRMIDFEYSGRPYTAFCPAAAVFDIYEKFGVCSNIPQKTKFYEKTREGWDACCWLLAEFARWGEIARRKRGEDPRPMLTMDELLLAPATEADRLQELVMDTLTAGFRRDVASKEDDEEIDLVLQGMEETEKKRATAGELRAAHLATAANVLGYAPGDALMLSCGELNDLVAFIINARENAREEG